MSERLSATKQIALRPALSISLHPTVNREQINEILERIYLENGCTGCGLGGRDLFLRIDEILYDRNRFTKLLQSDIVLNVDVVTPAELNQRFSF